MTRRCSHCNSNGHNNRTCSTKCGSGGLRLFGVRLTNGSFIKKSASMGNLSHHSATSDSLDGYHSDEPDHGFTARRRPLRKKGVPWSEQEHMQFLLGLEKLGKGNWRAISRNYVPSRTPTQVASHAQKYFIRQSNSNEPGKKKRPSLFDMEPSMETNPSTPDINTKLTLSSSQAADTNNSLPSLDLSLKPAFTPLAFQLWPPNAYPLKDRGAETSQHQISRHVSFDLRKEPVKELVGMSHLTLEESGRVHKSSISFNKGEASKIEQVAWDNSCFSLAPYNLRCT